MLAFFGYFLYKYLLPPLLEDPFAEVWTTLFVSLSSTLVASFRPARQPLCLGGVGWLYLIMGPGAFEKFFKNHAVHDKVY